MNNEAKSMTVAETIHAQLGGRTLYMLGAKGILADETGLHFRIGRNAKSITNIRIELAADDTYTVRFFRIRARNVKEIAKVDGVYVDALHRTIEEHTGLATSL